jgi:hypothetical protein
MSRVKLHSSKHQDTTDMGLFSKLFGDSKSMSEPLRIPGDATTRDVINIAINSVIQQAGGNCATLEPVTESGKWVQIMDATINCNYPHRESPEVLFPELCGHPLIAGLEGYEDDLYMTVSLKEMNHSEIAAWIESYFSQVLAVDPHAKMRLRMENL